VPYAIEYTEAAERHLQALTARQRAIVLDAVEEQLAHQPTVETRNRKRMRANPLAGWELRVGELRVYFDVEEGPDAVVTVRGIGIKERDQVWLAGERSDF
jgi:mRNA-degrading endonuclease RelE of RelBE toxin-antitoxin system